MMIHKCQSLAGSEIRSFFCIIDYPFDSIGFIGNKAGILFNNQQGQKNKNKNKQQIADYLKTCSRKNSMVVIITAQAGETFNRRGTRPRKEKVSQTKESMFDYLYTNFVFLVLVTFSEEFQSFFVLFRLVYYLTVLVEWI